MNWPLSQDYNEAVQNPATSFSDPDLKKGEVVLNALGLPVPRSGNFADVYEFTGGDGKKWALKCFTRKVAGLQERYAKIDEHLTKAQFPFTVGFKYMAEGIKVRGQWYPLLKMEWVEGFTLNEFIRDNADKKQYLHALMQMWGKLTALLRDGNFAHADLQHGNVLLVPATTGGKLGLRLIDYDGMWVPALAETHSGEVGHPNFQHPLRLKDRLYTADVDRFPHLVIAAALRATLLGGKALWTKFDNGDNLLFKEGDLRDPANAPVFKTLWNLHDDVLCTLVGKLAIATQEPLRRTPWLDDLLLTDEGKRLNESEEAKVLALLGVDPHFTAAKTPAAPAAVPSEFDVFAFEDETAAPAPTKSGAHKARPAKDEERKPKKKSAKEEKAKSKLPLYIGGGVAAVALIVGTIIAASGGKKDKPSEPEVAKVEPKNNPPKVVIPPVKKDNTEVKVDNPPKKKDDVPPKKDPVIVAKNDLAGAKLLAPQQLWKSGDGANYSCLEFLADGSQIVRSTTSHPRRLFFNFVKDGKEARDHVEVPGAVSKLHAGPGNLLILTTNDKKLIVFDHSTQQTKLTVDVASILISYPVATKLNAVMSFEPSAEVGVNSLADGKKIASHPLPASAAIKYMDCSADGATIVAYAEEGDLYVKTAGMPAFKSVYKTSFSGARRVKLSPDAAYMAVSVIGEPLRILETATGKEHRVFGGTKGGTIVFNHDGRYLFIFPPGKTVQAWDVEAGKLAFELAVDAHPKALALSPDGQFLAVGTENSVSLQMWRLPYEAAATVEKKEPVVIVGAPALLKAPFSKEQAEKARADWAKFLNVPEKKELDLGKGVKLELVLIPPGDFVAGVQKKGHDATIGKPFYMAVTETTQEQYHAIMGKNPSWFSATGTGKKGVAGVDTSKLPVENVLWKDAVEFCEQLKGQLPTEVQWEYACRAGTIGSSYFGEKPTEDDANFTAKVGMTTRAGSYQPNAFGLHDTLGNVWEWCGKEFDDMTGGHVRRGGSHKSGGCRAIAKLVDPAGARFPDIGFRMILPIADQAVAIAPPKKDDRVEPKGKQPAILKSPFTKAQAEKARADWAKYLNIPETKELDLGKGAKLEVALIPPGEFLMGSSPEEQEEVGKQSKAGLDREDPRQVIISMPFYMAVNETTQEQYESVMGNNPSSFSVVGKGMKAVAALDTKQLPVESVSWNDAKEFCSKAGVSLPTEAQWEYACRAGTTTAFHFGNSLNGVEANCNGKAPFGIDAAGPFLNRSEPVRQRAANAFGLHDMHGNAGEWCRDFYDVKLKDLSEKDPDRSVKRVSDTHLVRGGNWGNLARDCRSAFRIGHAPDAHLHTVGFRVMVPVGDQAVVALPKKDDRVEPKPDPNTDKFTVVWKSDTPIPNNMVTYYQAGERILIRAETPSEVKVISAKDGAPIEQLKVFDRLIRRMSMVPNDLMLVSDDGMRAILWDLKTNKQRNIKLPPQAGYRSRLVAENNTVITPQGSDAIHVYSLADGSKVGSLTLESTSKIENVACTADGKTIVAINNEGDVFRKTASDQAFQIVYRFQRRGPHGIQLSPDASTIVTGGVGPLNAIHLADGKQILKIEATQETSRLSSNFSPDSQQFLLATRDNRVRIFDLKTGRQIQEFLFDVGKVEAFRVSPDGRFAIVGGTQGCQLLRLPGDFKGASSN